VKTYTLAELSEKTKCEPVGNLQALLTGVNDLESAEQSDVSFLANPRYEKEMKESKAGVIVIGTQSLLLEGKNYLISPNPSETFQEIIELFFDSELITTGFTGIDSKAVIHESAKIGAGTTVMPYAVIDKGVVIGKNCKIGAHVSIGPAVRIGDNVEIHANVVIREAVIIGNECVLQPGCVIGSCGFGYIQDKQGRHVKLKQLGTVEIQDRVEIGANTTIDRARFKKTIIKEGTKIDNLVQIAHGVEIGKHSLIISQSGIAGSAKIGNYVILAGKSAINGHISICDQVVIGACSGVSKSITKPGRYAGVPVMELSKHNKTQVLLRNIEQIVADIKEVKEKFKK
jgi:UDP-3-O-[3-hydroxymyristoyl] glucosamine N-acyltransferase